MRRPVNWATDKGVVIHSWEDMEVPVRHGITVYLVIHFRRTELSAQSSSDGPGHRTSDHLTGLPGSR